MFSNRNLLIMFDCDSWVNDVIEETEEAIPALENDSVHPESLL